MMTETLVAVSPPSPEKNEEPALPRAGAGAAAG